MAYSGWPGWMAVSKGRMEADKVGDGLQGWDFRRHGRESVKGSIVHSFTEHLLQTSTALGLGIEHKEKLTLQGWR